MSASTARRQCWPGSAAGRPAHAATRRGNRDERRPRPRSLVSAAKIRPQDGAPALLAAPARHRAADSAVNAFSPRAIAASLIGRAAHATSPPEGHQPIADSNGRAHVSVAVGQPPTGNPESAAPTPSRRNQLARRRRPHAAGAPASHPLLLRECSRAGSRRPAGRSTRNRPDQQLIRRVILLFADVDMQRLR